MNTDLVKLPFYEVYYTAEPLQAKEDLKTLFKDSTRIHNDEIAREAFLYFTSTARKYGFQLYFTAPIGFFNADSLESFQDGYRTPSTDQLLYKGLPKPRFSEKFN